MESTLSAQERQQGLLRQLELKQEDKQRRSRERLEESMYYRTRTGVLSFLMECHSTSSTEKKPTTTTQVYAFVRDTARDLVISDCRVYEMRKWEQGWMIREES